MIGLFYFSFVVVVGFIWKSNSTNICRFKSISRPWGNCKHLTPYRSHCPETAKLKSTWFKKSLVKPKLCSLDYNLFCCNLYLPWKTIPQCFAIMVRWKTKQLPLARVFTNPCPQMMLKHDVFVICFFCRLSSSAACIFQASINQPPRYCSSSLSGYIACICRLCHSTRSV